MPTNEMLVQTRDEAPEDANAIRDVNRRAFGQDEESNIVDAIRSNQAILLSLVAMLDGQVVGHILYSPASIGNATGAALGPVAVVPEYQRQGIGSKLIEAGNRKLKDQGCPFIIVLGHPTYYPRFGFKPAAASGIQCQWKVPDDVFMLLILDENRMAGVTGLARYRPEFG